MVVKRSLLVAALLLAGVSLSFAQGAGGGAGAGEQRAALAA